MSNYSLSGVYDDFFTKKPTTDPSLKPGSDISPSEETQEDLLNRTRQAMDELIGLGNIKEDFDALIDYINIVRLRERNGLPTSPLSLHSAFIGNPGTGKTTIAKLMGDYFKAIGLLNKGHVIEATRADLVAEYVGGTAIKTNKLIDSALDGILFVDEAYSLAAGGENDFGQEAINTLVARMDKDRERLAVFFAGYEEEMGDFFSKNTGLASRVTRKFHFNDYKPDELMAIHALFTKKGSYVLEESAKASLKAYFSHIHAIRDQHFGNGREVRNTYEKIIKAQAGRLSERKNLTRDDLRCLTADDIEKATNVSQLVVDVDALDQIMSELDAYVGLHNVKDHIQDLINLVKTNKQRLAHDLPVKQMTYHAVFCGAPGTGKTTIARILGKVYQSLGILKIGHVVEVDRSGLIGGYVGQTEAKTKEVIDRAMDGILFVDEAYALATGSNDFGRQAINTLLKRMDDDRERLIVIVAGYTEEMKAFINTNPGLKNRFTRTFDFENFTSTELAEIYVLFAGKQKYTLEEGVFSELETYFEELLEQRPKHFGNGRFVRNLFERTIIHQSNRLMTMDKLNAQSLSTITLDDVLKCLNEQ